jgi:hypothetical protein
MVNDHDGITRRSFLKMGGAFILSLLVFGSLLQRRSSIQKNGPFKTSHLKEAKYYATI